MEELPKAAGLVGFLGGDCPIKGFIDMEVETAQCD